MQILVAEDDISVAELYRVALETQGHKVTVCLDGRQCIDAYNTAISDSATPANSQRYHVVILDYKMPFLDGMEVAKKIKGLNPSQRIILATAQERETLVDSIKELGQIIEIIPKPFEPDSLVASVEDTSAFARLQELNELTKLTYDRESISNSQIDKLLQMLRNVQRLG